MFRSGEGWSYNLFLSVPSCMWVTLWIWIEIKMSVNLLITVLLFFQKNCYRYRYYIIDDGVPLVNKPNHATAIVNAVYPNQLLLVSCFLYLYVTHSTSKVSIREFDSNRPVDVYRCWSYKIFLGAPYRYKSKRLSVSVLIVCRLPRC